MKLTYYCATNFYEKCPEFALTHNAALSGEQRRPLNLKHCAVNTKVEATKNAERWESVLNALLGMLFQVLPKNKQEHFNLFG
ncbi:hypothetical protein D8T22_14265 [Vibrio vulnificus]|nr:hypothetical protein D8T22_14265 [Vibrio vulnificus]